MIPEAAVEAVAKVLVAHQRRDSSSCLCGWARLGFSHATHQAALALEAAAPHMCAHLADSDLILEILESAGVEKANQFDALVAVQKLTAWEATK